MPIIQIENYSYQYKNTNSPALDNISIAIEPGEFVLICGISGSGKSTLLRTLKPALLHGGIQTGNCKINNRHINQLTEREQIADIAYVQQNPDSQILTDKVCSELAWISENLGIQRELAITRIAETAAFLNLDKIFRRSISTLSSGQKQIVNLASAMTTNPQILILDEPLAELDPVSTLKFLHLLEMFNKQENITIIISEHKLESCLPLATRLIVLENGRKIYDGNPTMPKRTFDSLGGFKATMPAQFPLLYSLNPAIYPPITAGESRRVYRELVKNSNRKTIISRSEMDGITFPENHTNLKPAIKVRSLSFGYSKDSIILDQLDLTVHYGEIVTVLGNNGSGKSTLLSIIAGRLSPSGGKMEILGKNPAENKLFRRSKHEKVHLAFMPADPILLFCRDSVLEDFELIASHQNIREISEKFHIMPLLKQNPYDLSGGELQRCALALLLLAQPDLLLIDEPVKGLDFSSKMEFGRLLKETAKNGAAILCVSHSLEFAAEISTRCALIFDGKLFSFSDKHNFFKNNRYYTTQLAKITTDDKRMFEV